VSGGHTQSQKTRRRRIIWFGGVLAIALVAGALSNFEFQEVSPQPPVAHTPPPTPTPPEPAAVVAPTVDTESAAALSSEEPEASIDAPALQTFLELTRHPTSSRPLSNDSFDLLNPDTRYEQKQSIGDEDTERGWEVLFTADRYAVRGNEAVAISLELWKNGERVAPESVRFVAEAVGGGQVDLPAASSGTSYRAAFTPEAHWPNHLGTVHVKTTFRASGLEEQTGSLAFYFTPSALVPGRFTGNVDDHLDNGNLVVEVGVEIDTPGTYRIEANLYDAYDQPIAWARFQGDLTAGTQDAPLSFHGLIFHDQGAAPPFILRDVRGHRMRPGDAPHREDIPSPDGEWKVADDFILADFSQSAHQSPRKEKMVKMYQDAMNRGVKFIKQ
jgi:hypothetical protein